MVYTGTLKMHEKPMTDMTMAVESARHDIARKDIGGRVSYMTMYRRRHYHALRAFIRHTERYNWHSAGYAKIQEAHLSPKDHAMHRVS